MIDTRHAFQAYPTPNLPMPQQLRAMANLEIRLAIAMQSDPAARIEHRTATDNLIRRSQEDHLALARVAIRERNEMMREASRSRTLEAIKKHGPCGTAQISAATGLSRSHAGDLAKELAERGLLKAEKTRQSGAWVYAVAA